MHYDITSCTKVAIGSAAAALMALLVGACGSGPKEAPTTTTSTTTSTTPTTAASVAPSEKKIDPTGGNLFPIDIAAARRYPNGQVPPKAVLPPT